MNYVIDKSTVVRVKGSSIEVSHSTYEKGTWVKAKCFLVESKNCSADCTLIRIYENEICLCNGVFYQLEQERYRDDNFNQR